MSDSPPVCVCVCGGGGGVTRGDHGSGLQICEDVEFEVWGDLFDVALSFLGCWARGASNLSISLYLP